MIAIDNIDPMSRRISTVTPIRLERQPYFRKHYKDEYSCQCGGNWIVNGNIVHCVVVRFCGNVDL